MNKRINLARAALRLLPSKTNPRVKRWQGRGKANPEDDWEMPVVDTTPHPPDPPKQLFSWDATHRLHPSKPPLDIRLLEGDLDDKDGKASPQSAAAVLVSTLAGLKRPPNPEQLKAIKDHLATRKWLDLTLDTPPYMAKFTNKPKLTNAERHYIKHVLQEEEWNPQTVDFRDYEEIPRNMVAYPKTAYQIFVQPASDEAIDLGLADYDGKIKGVRLWTPSRALFVPEQLGPAHQGNIMAVYNAIVDGWITTYMARPERKDEMLWPKNGGTEWVRLKL